MATMSPAAGNFLANLHKFSDSGLTGLADNAPDVNRLGELLARGLVTSDDLLKFVLRYQPLVGGEGVDLQQFWSTLWSKLLRRPVEMPPVPHLRPKTVAAIWDYKFKVMFLPSITEAEYPDGFIKPRWGQYLTESAIKRRPLPGRWVAVETIAKPHWNTPGGYGAGDADPFARALGLETRFSHSWDELSETILPAAANLLGVSSQATRRPSAEEWNLVGNLFNWLRLEQGEALPDLGSTNSWEWCENASRSDYRLAVGGAERGGLADVGDFWHGDGDDGIGFRVLVVL